MASEPNQDRAIGRLEGKVDAILTAIAQSETAARESRAKTYERLEKIDRDTTANTSALTAMKTEVSTVALAAADAHKVATDTSKRLTGMQIRAAKLVGYATALGGAVGFLASLAKEKLGM